MTQKSPLIDSRNHQILSEQLFKLVALYCPEWSDDQAVAADPQASALINIFSRMMELVIRRMNQSLDKNLLAFLDLIGVQLKPPRPSRVPLTFTLAKGVTNFSFIPAKTQVATDSGVIFETEQDLTVNVAKLDRIISVAPQTDSWNDHTTVIDQAESQNNGCVLFEGNTTFKHRLYLGCRYFKTDVPTTIKLNVKLAKDLKQTLANKKHSTNWGVNWYILSDDNQSIPIFPTKSNSDVANLITSGEIIFDNITGIVEQRLTAENSDFSSYWIYAETAYPVLQEELPVISKLQAAVTSNWSSAVVLPDVAFFNQYPIDLTKDFFPFGEHPKFNDVFYLAAAAVFSKYEAMIELTLNLTKANSVRKPVSYGVKLVYEYWNGTNWVALDEKKDNLRDKTNAFTSDQAKVSFKCPLIEPCEVNGVKNYWLRIRISDGNYGEELQYQEQTVREKYLVRVVTNSNGIKEKRKLIPVLNNGNPTGEYREEPLGQNDQTEWIVIPASIAPPSLQSITLQYTTNFITDQYINLDYIISENNFNWMVHSGGNTKSFSPFVRIADVDAALYLAFEQDIKGLPVTLLFSLISTEIVGYQEPTTNNSVTVWEYWNGSQWLKLSVIDGTNNLTATGIVQFLVPADFAATTCFGETSYWLRIRVSDSNGLNPKLAKIISNVVWASNAITVKEEILGSSNGNPGQVFRLANTPVLPGQAIFVKEPILADSERAGIIDEIGADAIREIRDEAGNIKELWVKWLEVDHFYFSKPDSRHYCIDRQSGAVTFGDLVHGMIPPAGKDNIKCAYYSYGGGSVGNVPENTVTKLRTALPYIAGVTNPIKAFGGYDQEVLERAKQRGPQTLKHRGRAVTYEDYEWLVREIAPEVCKVKCLPTTDSSFESNRAGWVTIIVVPYDLKPRPLPNQELLTLIRNYLEQNCLTSLVTEQPQINLIGPSYLGIGVDTTIVYDSIESAKVIENEVKERLTEFFHPLIGGGDNQGWDFGRNIYISEIYEVISKVPGVNYVANLSINPGIQLYSLTIKTSELLNYPKYSQVWSTDRKIVFSLAHELIIKPKQQVTEITFTVVGFIEGELIELSYRTKSVQLRIVKVRADELICETLNDTPLQDDFPVHSVIKSRHVQTYVMNEILSETKVVCLKVATLETNDRIKMSNNQGVSFKLETVSTAIETVYIPEHYLPYAGEFRINQTSNTGQLFKYLKNKSTGEVHQLQSNNPNCQINEIKKENRVYLIDLNCWTSDQAINFCDYCNPTKELSPKK